MAEFIEVNVKGLVKVTAKLERLGKTYLKLVVEVMEESAIAVVVPAIQLNIIRNGQVFKGRYLRSQIAVSGVKGREPFMTIGAVGVLYGKALESGAPPHSPKPSKIREWVRTKMGLTGGRLTAVTDSVIDSIKKKGTNPHPNVLPAWNSNKERFYANFVARMRKRGIK